MKCVCHFKMQYIAKTFVTINLTNTALKKNPNQFTYINWQVICIFYFPFLRGKIFMGQ